MARIWHTMKCPGCGADVVERAVYCHLCGERLDAVRSGPAANSGLGAPDSINHQQPQQNGASQQSGAQRFRDAAGGVKDEPECHLWQGGYSAKAMMGSWILGCFLTVCFFALGVWIWSNGWIRPFVWWGVLAATAVLWIYLLFQLLRQRLGVRYRLSSQRFFHEQGILRHTTDLIEVIDMDDITFEQSLIDRMTGVGSIRIVSSDRSHPQLTIHGIENVKDVAAKMHNARHAERLRRGLHIEQI